VKVELSRRAEREMQRIAAWWKEHASSPAAFLDELEQMIEHIETTSVLGAVYDAKARRTVYRRLMKKSACHVYLVRRAAELVVIVSLWGARRRRGPKFR
jgi:plasmid stabilization system protein ParE